MYRHFFIKEGSGSLSPKNINKFQNHVVNDEDTRVVEFTNISSAYGVKVILQNLLEST